MRHFLLIVLCPLVGCNAAPSPDPEASAPEANPVAETQSEPTVSLQESGETRWIYANDPASFHDAHLAALRAYDGGASPADALIPHADALEYNGASWGLGVSGKALLVPFASGPRVRMGDGDPHADMETPRYHDPEPWQTRAWRMLEDDEDVVENAPDFRYEFIGAIRNEAYCATCHDQQPAGALLGAWSYSLDEIADD